MPFTMYSAGPDQVGGGYLVFHETWVDVVLKSDSAWKQATKAKRKESNKLKASSGNWNVWFLLVRAFVLSRESMEENEREIGPAKSIKEAENHLMSAGKASAMASDARLHAILQALASGIEIPLEAGASDYTFNDWFEWNMVEILDVGNSALISAINGFYQAAMRLQKGYPVDVLKFIRALREQAWKAGEPPTKESIRKALGSELNKSMNKEEAIQSPSREIENRSKSNDITTDRFNPKQLTRLLSRTGFNWLPNGKAGPRRQNTEGKGRSRDEFKLNLTIL